MAKMTKINLTLLLATFSTIVTYASAEYPHVSSATLAKELEKNNFQISDRFWVYTDFFKITPIKLNDRGSVPDVSSYTQQLNLLLKNSCYKNILSSSIQILDTTIQTFEKEMNGFIQSIIDGDTNYVNKLKFKYDFNNMI